MCSNDQPRARSVWLTLALIGTPVFPIRVTRPQSNVNIGAVQEHNRGFTVANPGAHLPLGCCLNSWPSSPRIARVCPACDLMDTPGQKPHSVCVFITAGPITKLFAGGGGGEWTTCAGTREEPGTLTQGAPVVPGSSRLGIEPKTPGWLVQDPTTRPIGDLIPTIGGSGAHPWRGGLRDQCPNS